MYGLLFRALPGPAWVRVLVMLGLLVVAVWACVQWAFPWFAEYMPFNDNVVG